MAIEIYQQPSKQNSIEKMYATLVELGKEVDNGKLAPTEAYQAYDRMMIEIGMYSVSTRYCLNPVDKPMGPTFGTPIRGAPPQCP